MEAHLLTHELGEVAVYDRVRHILVLDGAGHVPRVASGLEPSRYDGGLG